MSVCIKEMILVFCALISIEKSRLQFRIEFIDFSFDCHIRGKIDWKASSMQIFVGSVC